MFYVVGDHRLADRIAICNSEAQASALIETLPNYEDGRYYIDPCNQVVNLPDPKETRDQIRRIVSSLSSIQNTSHGYLRGQNQRCRNEMHLIKGDADEARRLIRELAQHLNIEY